MIDYGLAGAWVGSVIAFTVATLTGYQQARKAGEVKVQAAQAELVKTLEDTLAAWKQRFSEEHEEYKVYRNYAHDKLNDANAALLKCSEDCAHLRAKTDITPVMNILERITNMLDVITKRLDIHDN